MSTALMQGIRRFPVERGSCALWWLGQNGFLVRSPGGVLLAIDAYLTDSVQTVHGEPHGLDLRRRVPVFIEPESLDVDFFLCTHSHDDHADPETIRRLDQGRISGFGGPGLTCAKFGRLGVAAEKTEQIYPGGTMRAGDIEVQGTFALPTDETDLNHVGFFLKIDNGPGIYVTGDTDYSGLLGAVGRLQPDLMITCINGGYNNLSHWEAAELAAAVKPRIAIPCHYDMFRDNSVDPAQFRASLSVRAPGVHYQQLEYVTPFVVTG